MNSFSLRQTFLNFFKGHDHKIVSSDSLIPKDDPTLLFTTAGMVQFKPFYTMESPPYKRATSVQKCLRAGGKQGDIDNVGKSVRHNTFFEMLGNFSFGSYFKEEAIALAWDFVKNTLDIPERLLWVSVHKDDDESKKIWQNKIQFPSERIVLLDDKDNFWGPAGSTGACGPCSELYIDLGASMDPKVSVGDLSNGGNRYIEFWNLVFPQYHSDEQGQRTFLKNKGVDTGMGLERLTFIMDHLKKKSGSIFETDLFLPIIDQLSQKSHVSYKRDSDVTRAMNVIADHIRAITFLLSENILPSNEGHGYVLRRLLRRAFRFGAILNIHDPFLHQLVPSVVSILGDVYDNLRTTESSIKKMVSVEEHSFQKTLSRCEGIVNDILKRSQSNKIIQGQDMFTLYDTYGFPSEMLADFAKIHKLSLDTKGFEERMLQQKEQSRKSWKGGSLPLSEKQFLEKLSQQAPSLFKGYNTLSLSAKVLKIFHNKDTQSTLVLTDQTCFYAKSGGQEGDRGTLEWQNTSYTIKDTQKFFSGIVLHFCEGEIPESITEQSVVLSVCKERRQQLSIHHTATHILHSVLRQRYGDTLRQAGSLIEEDYFRFDFTHFQSISSEELLAIEREINARILENIPLSKTTMPLDQAKAEKILMLFDEKYGDSVRVVGIDSARELCGGTHVERTGDIGVFKILSEHSIASGVRRIIAVAGPAALQEFQKRDKLLLSLEKLLRSPQNSLYKKGLQWKESLEEMQSQIKKLQKEIFSLTLYPLEKNMFSHKGLEIWSLYLDFSVKTSNDMALIKEIMDQISQKHPRWILCLGSNIQGKGYFWITVPQDLCSARLHAGQLVKALSKDFDGKGGGQTRQGTRGF